MHYDVLLPRTLEIFIWSWRPIYDRRFLRFVRTRQNQEDEVLPKKESGQNELLGITLLDPSRSLLKKWLTEIKNPDVGWWRKRRWRTIGWEVFERKSLLIAAASDLKENGFDDPMKLAAADVFVEKAQRILAYRGVLMYAFGTLISFAAVAILGFAAWTVYHADAIKLLQTTRSSEQVSNAYLTVLILKSTTAGAFVVAIAYFLVSLSRALLHEGTVLYSRRHSLRFGRLFVYLMSQTMTREDLVAVFNWNAEFSTAFKDIQAENITKSPLVKAIEAPGELAKALGDLVKPFIEKATKEKSIDESSKSSSTAA
jgi:hypothetical protein